MFSSVKVLVPSWRECHYAKEVDAQKILIVENEMITALDLRNQLRRLGYQVTGLAKSADEAVRLAEESGPDLVLMDVNLAAPMDGIEASKRIRERKSIPVVYLTAYPRVFIETPNQMQDPYMCISKPYSIPDLKAVIDIALKSQSCPERES